MKNTMHHYLRPLILIFSFIILIFPLTTWAAHADSGYKVYYLIDSAKQFSAQELSKATFNKRFVETGSNTLNFGLLNRAVWLKVKVPSSAVSQFMEIDGNTVESIDIYSAINNLPVRLVNERLVSNKYSHRSLLVELAPGSVNFLKIKSSGSFLLKYSLFERDGFFLHSSDNYLLIGLFLGFVASCFVFGLLMYRNNKDVNLIYYLLLVMFLGLNFSALSGVWGQYVVGQQLTNISIHIFTSGIILSALVFTRSFLNTAINHKNVDFLIKIVFIVTCLHLFFGLFLDSDTVYMTGHYLKIGVPALMLYFCINSLLQGYKDARFLVIGWFIYFSSFILTAFMYAGLLPVSFLTTYAMSFGTIAVIVFLSWALMDKFITGYDQTFAKNSKEGGKLSRHIEDLKSEILQREKEIKQHSELLGEKDQEIEYAQKRLREQATHDPLTKLINYQSFLLQFQHFFHDATRYHYPVITLLIDLDDFKELNDKYGLAVGNDVLKAVAKIVSFESRNTDVVARYGDDEIVFVMTHAILEQAKIKAEDLLSKIQKISIEGQPELQVTASIGVTVMGASERSSDYRFILDKVEKAVQKAQVDGGNCTNVYSYDSKHLEI